MTIDRNKGYRKKESKLRAAKAFYCRYPNLQKAMDMIESLEEEGRI